MNAATETKPAMTYVIYTATAGFVPRRELGDVTIEHAKEVAAFVRDNLKCPTVRLAYEIVKPAPVVVVTEDEGDEDRRERYEQEDNDNV